MIVKQLKPFEYSEDRKRALKESEERIIKLNMIGSPQKSLSQYEK